MMSAKGEEEEFIALVRRMSDRQLERFFNLVGALQAGCEDSGVVDNDTDNLVSK